MGSPSSTPEEISYSKIKSFSKFFTTSRYELSVLHVSPEVTEPSVDWLISTHVNYKGWQFSPNLKFLLLLWYFWAKRNYEFANVKRGTQGCAPVRLGRRMVKSSVEGFERDFIERYVKIKSLYSKILIKIYILYIFDRRK